MTNNQHCILSADQLCACVLNGFSPFFSFFCFNVKPNEFPHVYDMWYINSFAYMSTVCTVT